MVISTLVAMSMVQSGLQLPTPKTEDVRSIDAIVKALYDSISGPAGHKRDWERFRSLFAPGAQLIALVDRPDGSRVAVRMTPDEYVVSSGKVIEERGFFEKEVKRKSQMVEDMAHVWSDYESRMKADDAKPFQTGTNGIQLYNDNKRWWIASVMWQGR